MMKTILALSLLLSPLTALATTADKIDRLWALSLAGKLKKISKPQDYLELLPLSESNAEKIEQQIKAGQMKNFVRPIVTLPNETTVMVIMNRQTAEMDFKDFHKGVVYVNGHKIMMTKNSEYMRMRFQVQNALMKKAAALEWLLPEANAQLETPLIDFVSTSVTSSADALEVLHLEPSLVNSDNITQALQHAYAMEAKYAKDRANKKGKGALLQTYQFKCNGTELSDLYYGDIVRNGKTVALDQSDSHLHIDPKASPKNRYTYSTIGCKSMTADAKLVVTGKSEPGCPVDATFKSQDIFGFKPFAEACCKKIDCEKNVNGIVKKMADELTGVNSGPLPAAPQDGGAIQDSGN